MKVLRVGPLPEGALDAAAVFHADVLPGIRAVDDDLTIIFPPASREHHTWRSAAVQELARDAAPGRVNAVAGDDEAAIAEVLAFLEAAPGVTGQILTV